MSTPEDRINELADQMPTITSALSDKDRNLLWGIFQAGGKELLSGSGFETRIATFGGTSPGGWRIGNPPGGTPSKKAAT
ncbi:hypothetical protein OHA21_09555 [Actinoplanes sp. NBC_00393]|uniref:hypothetical protein n=1 Tax=Actinoplanes sp. NBC_00393 TaxID=2975953 RepID=UPI002E1DC078